MRTLLLFIKNNVLFCTGSILVLFLIFIVFFGHSLPIVDEELKEIKYIWNEEKIPIPPPYPPSGEHWLGTDRVGRDMLSLLVMGAKETLGLVVLITLLRYFIALPLAFFAHKKFGGAQLILNWLNGLMSYLPTIILVVLLAMLPPILFTESRPYYLILIIAIVEVGRAADMIKLEFDDLSSREFMLSGISGGAKSFTLFKSYYLPFLYGKILVYMITDLGRVMFLLGQLGFIGIFISQVLIQYNFGAFRIDNISNSWPMLLMDAFRDIRGPIWIPFYTAFAMTFCIFTFNLFAQGLQNIFQKKERYI